MAKKPLTKTDQMILDAVTEPMTFADLVAKMLKNGYIYRGKGSTSVYLHRRVRWLMGKGHLLREDDTMLYRKPERKYRSIDDDWHWC
jgi:hypothetical protein